MTTHVCPECTTPYSGAEQFCPHDGAELVVSAAVTALADAPAVDAPAVDSRAVDTPTVGAPAVGAEAWVPRDHQHDELATGSRDIKAALSRLVGSVTGKRGTVEPEPSVEPGVLPENTEGWEIQGGPISTKGYDQWSVNGTIDSEEVSGVFTRFKTGALTTAAVYGTLANCRHSSGLYSHGTVAVGGGARADYEITAAPKGRSLQSWLTADRPGVAKALYLAPLLVTLLEQLHGNGLRPITLDPNALWICTEGDAAISLGMFGAIATASGTCAPAYCGDLANSSLLTLPYAAPELIDRRAIGANSDAFAVGQLVSTALFGEPQDHAFIRNGSVPFHSIEDARLARVLMGTLWPEPEGRWSLADIRVALDDATDGPRPPPWASLRPGAAATAFVFNAEAFWLAEDLFLDVARNWDEACARLDEILYWLEGTRFAGQATMLRAAHDEGHSPDWVVTRLCRLITPDAPMVWRDLSLTDKDAERSLAALAQKALGEGDGAAVAIADMQRLFAVDLRGAFTTTNSKSIRGDKDE